MSDLRYFMCLFCDRLSFVPQPNLRRLYCFTSPPLRARKSRPYIFIHLFHLRERAYRDTPLRIPNPVFFLPDPRFFAIAREYFQLFVCLRYNNQQRSEDAKIIRIFLK